MIMALGSIAGSYAAGRLAGCSHTPVAAGSKLALAATLLRLGYARGLPPDPYRQPAGRGR